MSIAKVAWGWGAMQAANAPEVTGGKLLVLGEDTWTNNTYSGYPGYRGYTLGGTEWDADSDAALAAMVKWLTGLTTGATILVSGTSTASHPWSTDFRTALGDMGHTVTNTGSLSSWSTYDPLNFDLVICNPIITTPASYHGLSDPKQKMDYVLSNGGAVLSSDQNTYGDHQWTRYGFHADGWHASHRADGAPPPLGATQWRWQRPFYVPGDATLHKITEYWSWEIMATTNEKGGTSSIITCEKDAGGIIGLWSNP